jgi:two-component sensor histidine kinase
VHAIDISHSESARSRSQTPGDSDRPDTLETLVLPSALLGVATQPSQVPDAADGGGPDQPTGASAGATIDEPAAAADATPGDQGLLGLRRISHDIHHELATITVLASLLVHAPDVGPESKDRARQILVEIRWLDELNRAYEELTRELALPVEGSLRARIRLDALADEVVAAMRLATRTQINLTAAETWVWADRLACWRALRNVLGNAIRAAGSGGHVDIRVTTVDGLAVIQIDDDGPGLGEVRPGFGSLGLGIVQDLAAAHGGQLQIRRGVLGGCCVQLTLPASPVHDTGAPADACAALR